MSSPQMCANAIRFLSMDAVQKAKSGHPGMPMGMADIAQVLWSKFLKHNPNNPHFFNRDRFVLSNGHGSMLHYALLHLTGYDVSLDDLQSFRQLHSKTPGHPEYGDTPGVETTTGPLGQGLANGVGMAMAEKHLAAQFNQKDFPIVDHYTYVFVGDGCLMEGISHEAASLAGTMELGKLIVFYDDNQISIDGDVKGWFSDDTPMRFKAYHWQVIEIDGHDSKQIEQAIQSAQAEVNKPTLICAKTTIGFGAPTLAGTSKTHGAPLGDDEIAATRKALNWPHSPFEIPADIYEAWNQQKSGQNVENAWQDLFEAYRQTHPDLAQQLQRQLSGKFPVKWQQVADDLVASANDEAKSMASRKASLWCLERLGPQLPELIGGSADLTESNLTKWKSASAFGPDNPQGQYLHYGVREFGMSAIMNGIALHGALIPFGGTFLVFLDYARNALRLSAMMKQKVIYVFTHDSICLGEDGPTHQPIEHHSLLRMTPNLSTWRPCDTVETAVAWTESLNTQGPSALLLSRQNLDFQARDAQTISHIKKGGYILYEPSENPQCILIATGSEVSLAINSAKQLAQQKIYVRVVSMPCCEIFDEQEPSYQQSVLPDLLPMIAIEAAHSAYWYKYVGKQGRVIGLDSFGASAPCQDLLDHFNFSEKHICEVAVDLIAKHSKVEYTL